MPRRKRSPARRTRLRPGGRRYGSGPTRLRVAPLADITGTRAPGGHYVGRLPAALLRNQPLFADIRQSRGRLFGRAGYRHRAHRGPAGLRVVAGSGALHLRRPLNGTLVERRIDGGYGRLVLATPAQGRRSIERYGLSLGCERRQANSYQ